MYVNSILIRNDAFPAIDAFPFNVRVFQETREINLSSPLTFLVGRNGCGKSAMLDALSRKCGLLPWGGSKVHIVHNNPHETQLASYVALKMNEHQPYGFYFRAEAFFNFAGSLDDIIYDDPDRDKYFGGGSLNMLSHGESFLAFFRGYSFKLDGLYLMDEPEAALSPENQVEFVQIIRSHIKEGKKQYIIATHSPIILACPEAQILDFDEPPVHSIEYNQTRHYKFYKDFLNNPEAFLSDLSP